MRKFNPVKDIENSELILDQGQWPNFHDSEVHNLNIWRGDVRPDDNVWVGAVVDAKFELCALKAPYFVILKFHGCDAIRLTDFNHQNAVYDLAFEFTERGNYLDSSPLPPNISVTFEQAFGVALTLTCSRVEAIARD